ncbi:hypothetical protein Q2T41_15715 [Maribacter confluentis]|uniref:DUF2490 domain-containing protein n=1 Tax=Maribacter confluentis TaxID=1656093 RepID=A0ABT8RU28_9FLAO|nr:hypothetical protein [Maribacter confluentis]MDO1514108.1 hypothetical protein [Maribacter confluentis]
MITRILGLLLLLVIVLPCRAQEIRGTWLVDNGGYVRKTNTNMLRNSRMMIDFDTRVISDFDTKAAYSIAI